MQPGDTCQPFNYSNPADNTHWAGAGHILSNGIQSDWGLQFTNDITVTGNGKKIGFLGHVGWNTYYKYSFKLKAFWYTKPHETGYITMEAARSTGKGKDQQFRVKLWNKDKEEFATYWLLPNRQCHIYIPYNPIAIIHDIGVDSRDFNFKDGDYYLSKPYK